MTQDAMPEPREEPSPWPEDGSVPPSPVPDSESSGAVPTPSGGALSLFERVEAVIEQIRPAVQSDDGDVELVEVTNDGIVRIRFHGACVGCPSSEMTLQMGVERNVRERIPEVTAVERIA